ncbi:MAG: phosphoribosylanthranilate isomerase [Acidobacteriota bacterium]
MAVKVKICGVTRKEDALLACEMGAHAIGFVFADSPRKIEPEQAAEIASFLPAEVKSVGVFQGRSLSEILKIARTVRLSSLQIYDNHILQMLSNRSENGYSFRSEMKIIPAFFVRNLYSLNRIKRLAFPEVLIDRVKDGDTEPEIIWRAAKLLHYTKRVILAGGLNPDNVQKAIAFAHPHCVDVASSIESDPGVKDPKKMREFFRKVKEAEEYY